MTAGRRLDLWFLVIIAAALGCRLYLADAQPYIHDEDNNAIALAKTISFTPGRLNLPIRGENHLALPAYVVKVSGTVFGTTPSGYRMLHVVLGLCTITLVFLLTRQWYGAVAARWAAALLAFNEYYLNVSSRATAHVPQLLLVAAALYAFSRFLAVQRAGYLYATGALVGLAFYCKEHSALLLPVFFLALLQAPYRRWLRGPHAYLAVAAFVLVISPDLIWNAKTPPNTAMVTYGDQPALQATYASHLKRIGGVGFSLYPSMFFARRAIKPIYLRATGTELYDETTEYHSMNAVLGVLLIATVVAATIRPSGSDRVRGVLLILFWGLFAFFTFIRKGDPPGRLGPVSWMWVEMSILPAVALAGATLTAATGKVRIVTWAIAGGALLYAVYYVFIWVGL